DILRVKDLDRLPIPKRNYFKSELYRNKGTIISSRGCVAKCQFCAAGAFGAIRTRSAENVSDEIEILYNNGIKNIYFVDNTFASNRKRAIQIFRILEQKGIKINCFIEARVTEVDEEYIDLLKSFGVTSIQFGVETGNAEVMKSIHKNITLERVEKTVELCCQKGIGVACSFVIGHPADTEETVRDTIAFATRLKRMGAEPAFSIMTPYPGTEAYRKREELGVEIQDWNFAHWDLNRAVARTKNLSVRKMNKLHSEAMLTLNAI
ncbi:MAG: B12-binding domain-containing radical SAM protein, partial [Lachnospiraceae bacterium]|nr:B12-binding domain-containing radical SAM protein [Lachnospiraceae bacterium]